MWYSPSANSTPPPQDEKLVCVPPYAGVIGEGRRASLPQSSPSQAASHSHTLFRHTPFKLQSCGQSDDGDGDGDGEGGEGVGEGEGEGGVRHPFVVLILVLRPET